MNTTVFLFFANIIDWNVTYVHNTIEQNKMQYSPGEQKDVEKNTFPIRQPDLQAAIKIWIRYNNRLDRNNKLVYGQRIEPVWIQVFKPVHIICSRLESVV